MAIRARLRFTMGTVMMYVAAFASASALFTRTRALMRGNNAPDSWDTDVAALLVLAIGLTALAIAAARKHTASQAALQATATCVMLLSLLWAVEITKPPLAARAVRYWFQAAFLLTVVAPLVAMRSVLRDTEPDPRGDWWRGTGEAIVASFFNMILVLIGAIIQVSGVELLPSLVTNATKP